jgi:hypothetical protein
MKYLILVSLSLLFVKVNGQSNSNCLITDYIHKGKYGRQPIAHEILRNNLDSLTKDFNKEKTFSLKFYCFIKPEFKDSIINLKTDTIYISGKNSIDIENWEEDFKANLKLVIKQFEPYILNDSLINSNCKTLIYHSTVRRCR